VVCNFTPEVWRGYRIGVTAEGRWKTLLCSDAPEFGGSGLCPSDLWTESQESHGRANSLVFDVPPMSVTYLQPHG
jgi:1,4-alpha-glucan branching enzyme